MTSGDSLTETPVSNDHNALVRRSIHGHLSRGDSERRLRAGVLAAVGFCCFGGAFSSLAADDPLLDLNVTISWEGSDLPSGDQRPARVWLDFPELISKAGLAGRPDLGTLRVVRAGQDAAGGGKSLPFRWDPESLAGDFPSVEVPVDSTQGELKPEFLSRFGLYFNVSEESERGFFVWEAARPDPPENSMTYEISVAIRPQSSATTPPPRAWLGDGSARFTNLPENTTGSSHTRVAVADWNGDGLNDVVYGESSGRIFVMLNEGTETTPLFQRGQFLKDVNNLAIDVGQAAAPLVVDWDGDGFHDVLVGTHWNRLLYFKNTGNKADPRFSYEGVVEIDGEPIELPIQPVIGRPPDAFIRDYYPVPSVVDWDGDGDLDLLLGGYLTGRIYIFENTGKLPDGTPALKPLGPLMVDGQPLNVGDWGAAPEFADLTGDGLPDLLTGNFPMTRESRERRAPIRFFKNVGSLSQPEFREEPFPGSTALPRGSLYTPRLADFNGDGLLDLLASSGANIFLFPNTGTASDPKFSINSDYLRTSWGNTPISATQWIDWNTDGRLDAIYNYGVRLNLGANDPFEFAPSIGALPRGQNIAHPSGIGDDWFHPRFFDLDRDGDRDVLFGDWYGQIWFHAHLDDGNYDTEGYLLKLEDGTPIKVGPKDANPDSDFRALQGARTVFSAEDFTGDGMSDLVVGDTFGIVRLFTNTGTNKQPIFRETQTLGNLGTRLSVEAIDWNDDGLPDIIAGSAAGRVRVFLNKGRSAAGGQFEEGFDPGLPPIPQPRVIAGDLNGDGDQDLFFPSTQGSVWIERSFLRNGYAEGVVTGVRTRIIE